MKHGIMAVAGVAIGLAAALGVGCEGESRLNVVQEEGANAVHANLPAVPTLPPPPPANTADGAFTIYGVRHQAARNPALWSKQQRVHGWIVSMYVPRNPQGRVCTERDHCTEERPHIYIADTATEHDPAKQMMVTGYAMFQYEIDDAIRAAREHRAPTAAQAQLQAQGLTHPMPTDFGEGAEITVTGNFVRRAANGQADSAGLIEYSSHVTNTPAPPPPPAAHH